MIERARERFAGIGARARFVTADHARTHLPPEQDAIVSALSIHHLEDADKRVLFGRVHAALRPGGIFVNAEQVAPEPPATMAQALEAWQAQCRAAGASEGELAGARERMKHDRCAPLSAQLEWLREAGFEDVATPMRSGMFAVYSGRRPGPA